MMRPYVRSAVLAAVTASLVSVTGRAEAYRPFDGTDAGVAGYKTFELELGPINYYREGRQNYLITPDLVLNFGIFERAELVIDADQFVALGRLDPDVPRVSLLGDDVLIKYVIREGSLQDKTGVSIAAEGGVLTPEVNGYPALGGSLDVITSYEWSWGAMHYDEWFEFTRNQRADLYSGVILEGPHDWTVRPVAELFYDKDFAGGSTESALAGAIWTVNDSLAFDAGLRGARIGSDNAVEARLGLTWAVPLGSQGEKPAQPLPHASRRVRPDG